MQQRMSTDELLMSTNARRDRGIYITIKYHNSEFPNKIPCRLINPSKPSIGKVNEVIRDRISTRFPTRTNFIHTI